MTDIHKIASRIVMAKDLKFLIEMEAELMPIPIADTVGSFFGFYVKASFDKLKKVFGMPSEYDPDAKDKTRVEWAFKINNDPNLKFSIYDYKDQDIAIDDLKEFHVGIKSQKTKNLVKKILDLKNIKYSD